MTININEMTIGEAKELSRIFGNEKPHTEKHPLDGEKVVMALANGFVFVGRLSTSNHGFRLDDAQNVRFWAKREGGLPELAMNGRIAGDELDTISGPIFTQTYLFCMKAEGWS